MNLSIKESLSRRISIHIIILSVLFFSAILSLIYVKTSGLMAEEGKKSIQYAVKSGSAEINGQIIGIETATKNLAWQVDNYKNNRRQLELLLNTFVRENDNIFGCSLAPVPENSALEVSSYAICAYCDTITNKIIISSLYDEQYDYLMTNWYLIPKLLKKPVWTEPYYDEGNTNGRITTYAFPVLDEENKVTCIIAAHISLNWIARIAKDLDVFPHSKVSILSKGGIYAYSSRRDGTSDETFLCKALETGNEEIYREAHEMINNRTSDLFISTTNFDSDNPGLFIFNHLKNGWGLVINTPMEDIVSDVVDMSIFLVVTSIVGLFLLFLFIVFIIRKNIKPIKEFSKAAGSIAKGNFDTTLPKIRYKDETYILRNSLFDMQKDLEKYLKEHTDTIASKKIYEKEISIAQRIQSSMLPSDFHVGPHIDIFGMVDAAKVIGGDLFGFFEAGGKFYFYIGDVSGKGIPAAMYMSFVVSAMELEFSNCSSLGDSIAKINNYLCSRNSTGQFITLFCACLDLESNMMEYCNCGHNPIVMIPPAGKPGFLKAEPNIVLSAIDDFQYRTETMAVASGTKFILYTDGVTEAERKDFSQYTEQRLLDWAEGLDSGLDCRRIAESLKRNVIEFTEGNIQSDDMTILAVKVK